MPGCEQVPATLSRRSLLRGAAVVVGVLVLGPACTSSSAATDADPLRVVGQDLAAGPNGAELRARAGELGTSVGALRDEAAVRAALRDLDAETRADFANRRTVIGRGWVLSRTEAAVLVAYAGTRG